MRRQAYRANHDREKKRVTPWKGAVFAAARWLAFMVMTTMVASLFTGLPAIYHFNRLSPYGVLANILALPIVTGIVMPAALIATLAMPLGLERLPLQIMGLGLEGVVAIASNVAALPRCPHRYRLTPHSQPFC